MPPQPPPQPVVTNGAIVAGGSPAVTSSASLAAQAALAAAFYGAQAWLAVAATRDILQIWQALNLRDVRQSWPALRTALAALVRDRYGQASALGTGYYQQARRAAGVLGEAPRVHVPPPPADLIRATLDSTGPYGLLGRIKTGQQVEQANENTGVILSGATQRLIINGARYGVLQSVEADAKAVAWMRVTGPNPCAFCAMLASRGAVYKSEETGGFKSHSHCACVAMPVFDFRVASASYDNPLYQQWKQATKGKSGKDALRAWRQYWDAQQGRDGLRILPAA